MSLTYSVCYTKNKNKQDTNINYFCSDNRIHLRFRDYNTTQVIKGFEPKLTYLITYLMNYSYLPTVINKNDSNTLIKDFLKSRDLNEVYDAIKLFTNNDKFKGFKLAKNYHRRACKDFGELNLNCFPLDTDDEVVKTNSLKSFLANIGNLNLDDYLFNDDYSIIIHQQSNTKLNKFEKKAIRKKNKFISQNSDLVKL